MCCARGKRSVSLEFGCPHSTAYKLADREPSLIIGYSDLTIKNNNKQTALDVAEAKEIRNFISNYYFEDIKESLD